MWSPDLADGSERANTYGQAADHFGNTGQTLGLFPSMIPTPDKMSLNLNETMAQPEPNPQATAGASSMDTSHESKSVKGVGDEANWERPKKRKIETESEVEALTQKKMELEDEIRALEAKQTRLNQASQSRGGKVDKLKHQPNRLMTGRQNQDALLVDILSKELASSVLSLKDEEIQKLQDENAKLKRQNVKLQGEKEKLELLLNVACEKLMSENSSPEPSS